LPAADAFGIGIDFQEFYVTLRNQVFDKGVAFI
jgi:hypothetical protein